MKTQSTVIEKTELYEILDQVIFQLNALGFVADHVPDPQTSCNLAIIEQSMLQTENVIKTMIDMEAIRRGEATT